MPRHLEVRFSFKPDEFDSNVFLCQRNLISARKWPEKLLVTALPTALCKMYQHHHQLHQHHYHHHQLHRHPHVQHIAISTLFICTIFIGTICIGIIVINIIIPEVIIKAMS